MSDHVLHLGDCIEGMRGLADKSVDHVICDPPYSDDVHRKFAQELRSDGASPRAPMSFECVDEDRIFGFARHITRVCRRWIIVFGDEFTTPLWRRALVASGGEYIRKGIWLKTNPMPQMTGDRPANGFEDICIAYGARPPPAHLIAQDKRGDYRGRLRWNGGGRSAVWAAPSEFGTSRPEHPCPKPLALMEALVSDFTDPGELICDPFAGSGTTGVACKRLGRRFIGWEKDPKFHAAAVKRIEAARQQGELFARGPKPKQARLLP